jgi:hypothetical protein
MAQLINEAKRFQKLANIKENIQPELSSKEQKVADDILNAGMLEEGKFNLKAILDRMVQWGKKGLLTLAIIGSVLASCNVKPKDMIDTDKEQFELAQKLAKQDSTYAAQQGKTINTDSAASAHYFNMQDRSIDNMQKESIESTVNEALRKHRKGK